MTSELILQAREVWTSFGSPKLDCSIHLLVSCGGHLMSRRVAETWWRLKSNTSVMKWWHLLLPQHFYSCPDGCTFFDFSIINRWWRRSLNKRSTCPSHVLPTRLRKTLSNCFGSVSRWTRLQPALCSKQPASRCCLVTTTGACSLHSVLIFCTQSSSCDRRLNPISWLLPLLELVVDTPFIIW